MQSVRQTEQSTRLERSVANCQRVEGLVMHRAVRIAVLICRPHCRLTLLEGCDEFRIGVDTTHDFGVDFEDVIVIRYLVGIIVSSVFGADGGMTFIVASLSEWRVEGVVNQWF